MCELARNSVLMSGFEHEVHFYYVTTMFWHTGHATLHCESGHFPHLLSCETVYTIIVTCLLSSGLLLQTPLFMSACGHLSLSLSQVLFVCTL